MTVSAIFTVNPVATVSTPIETIATQVLAPTTTSYNDNQTIITKRSTSSVITNKSDSITGSAPSIETGMVESEPNDSYTANVTKTAQGTQLSELRLRLLNDAGEPLNQILVTLHSDIKQTRTDDNGIVIFYNVPTGEHTVTFDHKGDLVKKDLKIDEPAPNTPTVQLKVIDIKVTPKTQSYNYLFLSIVTALIGYLIWKRRHRLNRCHLI